MNNDLISREALKKAIKNSFKHNLHGYDALLISEVDEFIDNAPTVEATETEIQEVLNKRCMTAVANEYLVALHGKRPQGEWKHNNFDEHYCNKCGNFALWSEEADGYYEVQSNFCPNCGADMREKEDQND